MLTGYSPLDAITVADKIDIADHLGVTEHKRDMSAQQEARAKAKERLVERALSKWATPSR